MPKSQFRIKEDEMEIWFVELRDEKYGTRGNVYVPAKNASEAERKALSLARKNKDDFSKSAYVQSCQFHCHINIVSVG